VYYKFRVSRSDSAKPRGALILPRRILKRVDGLTKHDSTANDRHYPILDALRFVLAFWVAVGHYGVLPLFAGVDITTPFGRFVTHAWQSVVFGTPAVIVFFVISGFCIHLPFRGDKKLAVGRYYLRRYTRILIPVAGALCVYRLDGQKLTFLGEHSILWESPLWSLACEEIYYAAYPLLRVVRQRVGWKILLPVVFAAGTITATTHRHSLTWHDFGPLGTSLILLPVWLLGCLLAEQADSLPVLDSKLRIWLWRFLIWLACWITEMLHFKAGVPYTQTMIWFGLLAYFWVRNEIAYANHAVPNPYLARAGAWSYSLYLVHAPGMGFYWRLPIPNLGYLLSWLATMFSSLGFSYFFYLLVERPSHNLARKITVAGATRRVASKPLASQSETRSC
jgi:peptidoglycan/LPS O-acetylase OafA/YrhL